MNSASGVALDYFHVTAEPDLTTGALAGTLLSSLTFQAKCMLEDLGLALADAHPEVEPGQYSVGVAWTQQGTLSLTVPLLHGSAFSRTYAPAAFRGQELLPRLLSAHPALDRNAAYLCKPRAPRAEETLLLQQSAPAPFRLEPESGELDPESLRLHVRAYPEGRFQINPGDLALLGGAQLAHSAHPIVCPLALLRQLAQTERTRVGHPFRECGWFLLGTTYRIDGKLHTIVEDWVPAVGAEGTSATLLFSEQTKLALSAEIARRGPETRVVGWVHTHGPISELPEVEPTRDAASAPWGAAAPKDIDRRFFSSLDVALHRKDMDPASVALVLDAEAAQANPDDVGRAFAAFGTIAGIVRRRALWLSTASGPLVVRAVATPRSVPRSRVEPSDSRQQGVSQ